MANAKRAAALDDAQRRFDKSVTRVRDLLGVYDALTQGRGHPPHFRTDVLRGAIVLLVAALDGLVLSLISAAIPFAAEDKTLGDSVEKWVKDDPGKFLTAFATADPLAVLKGIAQSELQNITFQRSAVIGDHLMRAIEVPAPWSTAAQKLTSSKRQWQADDVKKELDALIERRNRIAHAADIPGPKKRAESIGRQFVLDAVELVSAVGNAIHEGVKDKYCPQPAPRAKQKAYVSTSPVQSSSSASALSTPIVAPAPPPSTKPQ